MLNTRAITLILLALLSFTLPIRSASPAEARLEATVFSFDGEDFVRTNTTWMDTGQSAKGSKLDHGSAAYKALIEKHSFTGPATVFGQRYDANYAPLIGEDGKVSGALFVGIPK